MLKNIFANTFSKTEKIIISFFLALFIIPEILWSLVMNTIYELVRVNFFGTDASPLRNNFLVDIPAPTLAQVVLMTQFGSLFFSFLFFSFLRKRIKNRGLRWFLIFFFLLLSFAAAFNWLAAMALSHMQLVQ